MTELEKTKRTWWQLLIDFFKRHPKNRQELIDTLRQTESNNVIDDNSLSMFEGVLSVSEMSVRDIMVPRAQMVVIEEDMAADTFLPTIIDSKHSRFPVLNHHGNEVIGILLAKDLLGQDLNAKSFKLPDIVRPAVIIPESKRLNVLLNDFRGKHNHMAIVVDEYGNVSGLVTIEDVLEQIVGEIEDEYFKAEEYIKSHSKQRFTVKAHTPIDEFNDFFHTHFSDEVFDTIGGIVTQRFGHLPKRGDQVELDNHIFKILRADKRRIRLVEVTVNPQHETIDTE